MSKNGNTSPLFKILERKRVLHIDLLTFVQIVNNLVNKFLVRVMIKFRITKEKEKEEDTIKRPQQNV